MKKGHTLHSHSRLRPEVQKIPEARVVGWATLEKTPAPIAE